MPWPWHRAAILPRPRHRCRKVLVQDSTWHSLRGISFDTCACVYPQVAEAHNVPAAVAKAAELNDPVMIRKRGRMMLPAPQVRGIVHNHTHCHIRTCYHLLRVQGSSMSLTGQHRASILVLRGYLTATCTRKPALPSASIVDFLVVLRQDATAPLSRIARTAATLT